MEDQAQAGDWTRRSRDRPVGARGVAASTGPTARWCEGAEVLRVRGVALRDPGRHERVPASVTSIPVFDPAAARLETRHQIGNVVGGIGAGRDLLAGLTGQPRTGVGWRFDGADVDAARR